MSIAGMYVRIYHILFLILWRSRHPEVPDPKAIDDDEDTLSLCSDERESSDEKDLVDENENSEEGESHLLVNQRCQIFL